MLSSRFLSPLPLLLIALLLSACEPPAPDPTVRLAGSTMGTSYDLKLVPTPGQTVAADFKTRVEAMLAGINRHDMLAVQVVVDSAESTHQQRMPE